VVLEREGTNEREEFNLKNAAQVGGGAMPYCRGGGEIRLSLAAQGKQKKKNYDTEGTDQLSSRGNIFNSRPSPNKVKKCPEASPVTII